MKNKAACLIMNEETRNRFLELISQLEEDAYEIRCNWSDFDGRSNLHAVTDITKELRSLLASVPAGS